MTQGENGIHTKAQIIGAKVLMEHPAFYLLQEATEKTLLVT